MSNKILLTTIFTNAPIPSFSHELTKEQFLERYPNTKFPEPEQKPRVDFTEIYLGFK